MEQSNSQPSDGGISVAEEALEQLSMRRIAEGDPCAKMAGIFKDNPLYNEWVEIMQANRRKDHVAQAGSDSE